MPLNLTFLGGAKPDYLPRIIRPCSWVILCCVLSRVAQPYRCRGTPKARGQTDAQTIGALEAAIWGMDTGLTQQGEIRKEEEMVAPKRQRRPDLVPKETCQSSKALVQCRVAPRQASPGHLTAARPNADRCEYRTCFQHGIGAGRPVLARRSSSALAGPFREPTPIVVRSDHRWGEQKCSLDDLGVDRSRRDEG
jgi:hypothetical protein